MAKKPKDKGISSELEDAIATLLTQTCLLYTSDAADE